MASCTPTPLSNLLLGASWWGRSWFLHGSKSAPCDASSVQFHVRLSKTKLDGTLKRSGQQGTYVTPKQDGNVADSSFAIVWIDAEAIALTKMLVEVPMHFGLVRTSKGKGLALRTCRGVRCKCDDFPTVFAKLRPSDTAPKHPKIAFMYTVQPVPIGATPDDIQKWMQAHEWEGRPVKALRNQTWLIGSAKEMNDKFLTWGGKSIMIRQTNSKYEKPQSAVIAGFVKHDHDPKQGQKNEQEDVWLKAGNDPWKPYKPTDGKQFGHPGFVSANVPSRLTPTSHPPARQLDAPSETRFKQHEEQLGKLESALQGLQGQVEERTRQSIEFEQKVDRDISKLKTDVEKQVHSLTERFDASLEKALRKQDHQIHSGFDEIKQLIRKQTQVVPAKKAKTAKQGPDQVEQPEEAEMSQG